MNTTGLDSFVDHGGAAWGAGSTWRLSIAALVGTGDAWLPAPELGTSG